jgi:phosphatidylserine synthase
MSTTSHDGLQQEPPPTILSFVKDLPNLCSLAGLACTTASIYFSCIGVYHAAVIGMIWAVAFDWADGLIARRMKGRTGSARIFGGQLDVLIDILSYGAAPAILLLSYGQFHALFLPGAFIALAAGVLRLSYFSTFGLAGGKHYTGLALDNNSIVLVLVFVLEAFIETSTLSYVLYAVIVALAALNVSRIKTPKLSGNPVNVWLLATYTIAMTGIHTWMLS